MKSIFLKIGHFAKRIPHLLWIGLRALVVFCLVVVFLVLVAVDLPPIRSIVVGQVNGVLQSMFAGQVSIQRVAHIGLTGVRGVRAVVRDAEGQLLLVDDADVIVSPISTLRSVLFGKGDMVIDLARVRLGYVDASVDADSDGTLRVQRAFEPKEAKKEDERD